MSCFSLSLPIIFVHFPSVLPLVSQHFSLLFISKHNSCLGPFGSSSQTFTLILSIWRGIKVCCKWLNCKFRHVDVSPTRILVSCTNKDAKLFQVWASASLMILLNYSLHRFGSSTNGSFFVCLFLNCPFGDNFKLLRLKLTVTNRHCIQERRINFLWNVLHNLISSSWNFESFLRLVPTPARFSRQNRRGMEMKEKAVILFSVAN